MARAIEIYDTTLRDGTQAENFNLSVDDKVRITHALDDLGVDYIEGGWPGSNPMSVEYFKKIRGVALNHARITSFGSTRRINNSADKDSNLQAMLQSETPVITIFGKSWDVHVSDALKITLEQNLEIIEDTLYYLKSRVDEVIYDAEKQRVVYQPVSIEPRVLVPKVMDRPELPDRLAVRPHEDCWLVLLYHARGWPSRLFCFDKNDGTVRWQTRIWARGIGGIFEGSGPPREHIAHLVPLGDRVGVFGVGHIVYAEGYDLATGKTLYRFSPLEWSWQRAFPPDLRYER